MSNEICYWLFCFVPIAATPSTKIFGFSEFLAAVALLAVVYTITDARYKFRIAVAPGSLYTVTFCLIALVGLQTLITEVWIVENWWVLKSIGLTRTIWQAIFGLLFLGIFLTWMYYAFIRPPIFGQRNARRFAHVLYLHILGSNDDDLKIIAHELARSAKSLVHHSRRVAPRFQENAAPNLQKRKKARASDYAYDIFLLIANRKFCRHIVSSSPVTAQIFFESMVAENKFDIPIGQFARNIASEAIAQKDSFLYFEAEGFYSGLLGYLKPVSQAIFGNCELVESLGDQFASPLDIHYEEQWEWNAKQWGAYCRATLMVLKSKLDSGCNRGHSYALNRAFSDIKSAYRDLYLLSDVPETYESDIYHRLRAAVEFIKDAIDLIDQQSSPPKPLSRIREGTFPKNIYDHLANLIFDICSNASTVKAPSGTCWSIHHNIVWSSFFGIVSTRGAAWKIVQFKVRRLLYDEIAKLSDFPNYKGSRILGFCLNVLGVTTGSGRQQYGRDSYALATAVQAWARKGYLAMRLKNSDVADSVLIGRLSFDERGNRLVITYIKGLSREAPKRYLELVSPLTRTVQQRPKRRRTGNN